MTWKEFKEELKRTAKWFWERRFKILFYIQEDVKISTPEYDRLDKEMDEVLAILNQLTN
jgi:hypothetical protein